MDSADQPELDETFELLRSTRRRFVLHYLRREAATADVSELASALAAWEADDGGPIPDETIASVETSLLHVHLPKLAAAGTLSYDQETGSVTLADTTTLDPYLSHAERVDRPVPAGLADDDDD